MAWVRPRAGCSCVLCGGPWPWARRGENEAIPVCVYVCVRVQRLCAIFCHAVFRTVVC